MTIASNLSKNIHVGNGLTTMWPYNFLIIKKDDIQVYLTEIATGIDTKVDSSLYTVNESDSTVKYPLYGDPVSDLYKVILSRETPLTQEVSLPNGGAFFPRVLEAALDKLTIIDQQQQEQLDRCVKTSISNGKDVDIVLLGQYADQAVLSAQAAALSESNSAISEVNAEQAAKEAAISAANAFASTAPAWSAITVYNYPDVVAYTDGNSYRCVGIDVIGEQPDSSINWARITLNTSDFFDIDVNGGLMPALSPSYSSSFDLDPNGDFMPK